MIEVKEILPHTDELIDSPMLRFFLAGTIDMGNSEDWQQIALNKIKNKFASIKDTNGVIHVYNPRRPNGFDENNKDEKEFQIRWELEHLKKSDIIIMNILGSSKSPISLLELGLFANSGNTAYKKLFVICPPEFYRYDNIRITCEVFGIKLYNTLNDYFNDNPLKY